MESTKDRIFIIAVKLFSTKGYRGTSMRDLARMVGIRESSLYNHFRGKEEILKAALDYQIEGFEKAVLALEGIRDFPPSGTDLFEIWMIGTQRFTQTIPPLSDQISRIILNEMFLNDSCRHFLLHKMFKARKDLTEQILTGLYSAGLVKECDLSKAAAQYVYMIQGMEIENHLRLMDGESPEVLGENLLSQIKNYIDGLRKL